MPGDRVWRVGRYASALAPLEALLLGLAFAGLIYAFQETEWAVRWHAWIVRTSVPITLAAVVVFLIPSLVLVWKTGGRRMRRSFLMIFLPLAAILIILIVLAVCLWLTGFMAMAFWSITH